MFIFAFIAVENVYFAIDQVYYIRSIHLSNYMAILWWLFIFGTLKALYERYYMLDEE